jgi:hypothetical protein
VPTNRALASIADGNATTACVFTDERRDHPSDAVLLVTARASRAPSCTVIC